MSFIVSLFVKLGFIGIAIGGVFAGKKLLNVKDDNIVEEVVEQIVEDELGVKIDLTPDSPEVDRSVGNKLIGHSPEVDRSVGNKLIGHSPEVGDPTRIVKDISQSIVDIIDKI